ncbi:SAV_915 family protein [Actinopolyspora sp. H202]|uniref:SAV_915 family protein n=1 Tax=Actinopolyspora sp. H202 TaxID=1500456 RepID=UPI003EE50A8C
MTGTTDGARQTRLPEDFPPMVYLPCEAHVARAEDAVVQLRELDDGRLVLPVYSALDRLHSRCGRQQPWLVMPATQLGKLRQVAHFDLVVLDMDIPEEQRVQEVKR